MPSVQTRRAAAAVAALATLVWAARRRPAHLVVAGGSMRPTLDPGDRLVALRTPGPPRVGGLVLAPDPRDPGRMLVKRVHRVTTHTVELRGDAADDSTDSRVFGAVPRDRVTGIVAYRVHPPGRVGPVSSRRARAGRPARPRRVRR